jgi:hypothetical protein
MFGKKVWVLLAALGLSASGCAWDTGSDPVYYEHGSQQQLANDPSGVGQMPNKDVAGPNGSTAPVQAGANPGAPITPPQEPEPQPWILPLNPAIDPTLKQPTNPSGSGMQK